MSGIWLFMFILNMQGEVVEYSAYPQATYAGCILAKDRLEGRPTEERVVYQCIDTQTNIMPEDTD